MEKELVGFIRIEYREDARVLGGTPYLLKFCIVI